MMRLDQLAEKLDLKHICGSTDREYDGVYAGDLLSWVMSNASAGDIWITIMSNLNVIAVASLTEVACVLLAENVALSDEALKAAEEKNITVFSSGKTVYELCVAIAKAEEE